MGSPGTPPERLGLPTNPFLHAPEYPAASVHNESVTGSWRYWLLLWLGLAAATGQTDWFPFAIDQDALEGAPDFSFLNHPLDGADRIFVRDGHFFRVGPDLTPGTQDDERVRFFGVNLAFGANFPAEADASRIARRLRRLGVNLVRLHHMDSQPDNDPSNAGSTLTRDPYPTLNPAAVARLRTFLDALKAEGIYVNVNLHVGYQFRPSVDQLPAHPAFPNQSKPLHVFFPRMVELQAEYARRLLEGLGLRNDPVLAMVEINNESSLVRDWQTGNLDSVLVGEYREELQRQWNAFLRDRYGATDALRSAWGATEPDGAELLPGRWLIENHAPARGEAPEPVDADGVPGVRVRVVSGGNWVIVKQVGFSLVEGAPYLAEIEIRADLPAGETRTVYWDVKQDVSPWRTQRGINIAVGHQWRRYQMAFTATFPIEGSGRMGLSVEALAGTTLYLRNWTLHQAGRRSLAEGQSLEAGDIALLGDNEIATEARLNDYLEFLADCDRRYLGTVLAAVRAATDELVPVTGTQMSYGGLLNLDSHREMDYLDNHFYVDHYNFPHVAWDGRDWRIRDSSSVGSGLSSFVSMAAAREFGRPYTVSEFNQPWPNRQGAEIDPTLAAFAAFQDWDAVAHFAYEHSRSWDVGVPHGFNLNGDWGKFANFGQAAWLFRTGAIRAAQRTLQLPVSFEQRLRAARERRNAAIPAFLTAVAGFDPAACFLHACGLLRDAETEFPAEATAAPSPPYIADTGEILYDPWRRHMILQAPSAAGVFGYLEAERVEAGDAAFQLGPSARGFAAVLITALDGRRLRESERLLVSLPGATLRSQPGLDPPQPQQLVLYPGTRDWFTLEAEPGSSGKPSGNLNAGSAPVWMERVECYVTLRTRQPRLAVYPLDGAGRRLPPLEDRFLEPVEDGFRIHLQADGQTFTPWYEIVPAG